MPTQPYYVDKTRVPGTTGIIGHRKECGGLVHAAWKLGTEGKDYREVWGSLADAGTLTHAMVESYIKKSPEPDRQKYPPEVQAAADKCFSAFLEWSQNSLLEPFETECSLVSRKYMFGGTLDAMFIKGKLSLGDFKTGDLYGDHLVQLAAYGILWEENFPDLPIDGGFQLLRFSRKGDFGHHWWGDLSEAREAFLLMRRIYDIDKSLKERL